VTSDVGGPDGTSGWDRIRVAMYSSDELAGEVLAHLGDVVALEPSSLRDAVLERLTALTGAEQ